MEVFWQLINEWEIQLLVLLSFTLQVLLFFTGSLRRCSTNALFRGTIWVAYLGADVVAIYALGSLSRSKDSTMEKNGLRTNHQLAFLWAPFLLIHLGGQDTITAFSIEDNKLWLRHLLNMLVQMSLALYVFWKSGIWHSMRLLLLGIFLFISGIIKYGERTLALMYGNLHNITSKESSSIGPWKVPIMETTTGAYDWCICFALRWAPNTSNMIAGRALGWLGEGYKTLTNYSLDPIQMFKLFDVEFCIMYSDLYTKARLLRTRSGVILRFISLVSTIVAVLLFTVSSKVGYGTADLVITYTLLYGGFLLEACAVLSTFIASPWIWAWLEAQKHHRLAHVSWSLLSWGSFGLQEKRPTWSNKLGQYSFLSYMGCDEAVLSLSQRVMSKIRKMARSLGIGEARNMFWLSKLLDPWYEVVDDNIRACLVKGLHQITDADQQQQWRHLGPFVTKAAPALAMDFIFSIGTLHLITEVCLDKAPAALASSASGDDAALADTCRKLSNYMFYLVVAHPASASLLHIATGSPEGSLELLCQRLLPSMESGSGKDAILCRVSDRLGEVFDGLSTRRHKETLEELRDMWIRLLLYAAVKSRPVEHAAQLAGGGELLSFAWLLLARHDLGDISENRIELAPRQHDGDFKLFYAINPRQVNPDHEIDNTNMEIS